MSKTKAPNKANKNKNNNKSVSKATPIVAALTTRRNPNQSYRPPEKKKRNKKPRGESNYSRGLSNAIGRSVGGFLGGESGSKWGGIAGDLFSHITGMGAYKVNRNSLLTNNGPPIFGNKAGDTIVSHREFVTDIYGSTAFTSQEYTINPSNPDSFPWLSIIAGSYEQYEMLGCVYEFKTTSGTAVGSTDTALGTVIMTTNYDVLDPPFQDKKEMESYEFTVSGVPCSNMIHPVECAPSKSLIDHLLTGPPQVEADARFHDLGRLTVATQGMQATTTVGELWVSYHMRLIKPRYHHLGGAGEFHLGITTPTFSSPLGVLEINRFPYATNSLHYAVSVPESGAGVVYFHTAGTYAITYVINGSTATTFSSPSYNNGALAEPSAYYYTNTNSDFYTASGNAAAKLIVVRIPAEAIGSNPAPNVTLGIGGIGATARADLIVERLPNNIREVSGARRTIDTYSPGFISPQPSPDTPRPHTTSPSHSLRSEESDEKYVHISKYCGQDGRFGP